jgi:hypothetical protein
MEPDPGWRPRHATHGSEQRWSLSFLVRPSNEVQERRVGSSCDTCAALTASAILDVAFPEKAFSSY